MRKGKSLIGVRVISEMDGADLGRVRDLVFDHDANYVLALLMSEKDLFGLIDAQIIPWDQITNIGPDAITVASSKSRVKAGDDARVRGVMNRNTALSGTRVFTTDGRDLGTLADTFMDDATGHIEGYELSSGFVSDTMTGKRFLPAEYDLTVGRDVALVPPAAAAELEAQSQHPGGVQGAMQSAGAKIGDATHSATESVSQAYANIANASVEKQKEFVIGKTAGRDVIIPADHTSESSLAGSPSPEGELQIPAAQTVADVSSSGEVVNGEILVRKGEVITALHAERATTAGVLGQLVTSAVSGAAGEAYASGKEQVGGAVASRSEQAEGAAVGKPAGREVLASDGSVIVAEGQIITLDIIERARLYGKEREVVMVAGLGATSQAAGSAVSSAQSAASSAGEAATNLWEAAKQKVAELTHSAHEKKAEMDAGAEQSKINHALGRPVTRVILDLQDNVILNTGDIITHAAIDRAREAGALDVLLDSVYVADPEITPDMMRAEGKGEASLESQHEHQHEQTSPPSPIITPGQ